MAQDIDHFVKKSVYMLERQKQSQNRKAPLQPVVTTFPFELVSIDYVHSEKSKGDCEYILVVIDHFTRMNLGKQQQKKVFCALDSPIDCIMT